MDKESEFALELALMVDMVEKNLPKAMDYLEEIGKPVYVGLNENKEIVFLTLIPNHRPNLQRWIDIRDSYMGMYAGLN